jgi:hypothetical protein
MGFIKVGNSFFENQRQSSEARDRIRWKSLEQVAGGGEASPMKGIDFYRQILGISFPWRTVNVELDMEAIIGLLACGNVTKMAEVMRMDWQTVSKIMKAVVERGLLRRGDAFIEHAGVCLRHRHRLPFGERPQRDAGQR